MTIQELAERCEHKIKQSIAMGLPSMAMLTLELPGQGKPWSQSRRLCGRSGPIGEIVADTEEGQLVAFDARKVLSWLRRKGLPEKPPNQ